MCGVFGIHAPGRDVARLTYFGLYALQHRGQESAGIAVDRRRSDRRQGDGPGRPGVRRADAAGPRAARRDRPHPLLDHRLDAVAQRQPVVQHRDGSHRRARPQRQPDQHPRAARGAARARRSRLTSTSDTEVICAPDRPRTRARCADAAPSAMARLRGAFSAGRADATTRCSAFRDPDGIRPLVLGTLEDGGCGAGLRDAARSTSSARASCASSSPASWSRSRRRRRRVEQAVPRRRRARRCASSSTSTSPAPTRRWTARRCTRCASAWAAAGRRGARPTPTS